MPETIQIELTGRPGSFVTGKDVILAVIGQIGVGGGTNAVLEFVGPGAEALSVDERLAVANMAVEAGSETGIFPADEAVEAYLEGRARTAWTAERSDPTRRSGSASRSTCRRSSRSWRSRTCRAT